jgi:hypothetical protein
MKGFRLPRSAQKFLAAFIQISPHFRPCRHLMTAPAYRAEMTTRFAVWDHITGVTARPRQAEPRLPPNPTTPSTTANPDKLTTPATAFLSVQRAAIPEPDQTL